ncbi:sigma-70 family RNA polymerase sigma factor [Bacillus sp. SCS-151]|uniref:sigma-70 family RNA polymerase sigma factor n=1 Tax=Nanhaiella sioensis TaxID=3115293 RepID=UPI00397962DC
MTEAEKLFTENKHIAIQTLFKMFGNNPKGIAKKNGLDYDDLVQFAYTGLWKGCISYDENKTKFITHAINNIRWNVLTRLRYESNIVSNKNQPLSEENTVKYYYLDKPVDGEEGGTCHDIVGFNDNIEEKVSSRIYSIKILSYLTDKQKKAVHFKAQGYDNAKIGEMMGTTRENVRVLLLRAKERLERTYNETI